MKALLTLVMLLTTSFSLAQPRVKIALIDSGLNTQGLEPYLCENWNQDLTGEGIKDTIHHGTTDAHLLTESIDPTKSCIIMFKYFSSARLSFNTYMNQAISKAIDLGVQYINISAGGEDASALEKSLLATALSKGIRIVVAAGNSHAKLTDKSCNYFPACYGFSSPNFYVVGNGDGKQIFASSNYGPKVNAWEDGTDRCYNGVCMSGSSMSTAIFTGKLVRKELK